MGNSDSFDSPIDGGYRQTNVITDLGGIAVSNDRFWAVTAKVRFTSVVFNMTSASDIAEEMGVSKGTVSKIAKKAIFEGWLTKDGREYKLVTG